MTSDFAAGLCIGFMLGMVFCMAVSAYGADAKVDAGADFRKFVQVEQQGPTLTTSGPPADTQVSGTTVLVK